MDKKLELLGLKPVNQGGFDGEWFASGAVQKVISPINGKEIASVVNCTKQESGRIITKCHAAFDEWRTVPAPKRAEVVRSLGDELRAHKDELAYLVTVEMGKTLHEGLGEVQEMIDICDFAMGLSRQLSGPGVQSERRLHRIFEQWHPLGVVAAITAFNFPTAVWSWNAALALACGDSVLWKPSYKTPLCGIACTMMAARALAKHGYDPAICSLLIGKGSEVGDLITTDPRVALVSYTGSVSGGRRVGKLVQERFGKHILELGGNNALIVSDQGDLGMALRAVFFGALGTAGQRCTTTRRAIISEKIYEQFKEKLIESYRGVKIGDPRQEDTFMGPLVDAGAVDTMMQAIEEIKQQGGAVAYGGTKLDLEGGCYVTPCIVEATPAMPIVKEETFAPVLYLMKYSTLKEAIAIQNDVPQGLSSSIVSNNILETELFLSTHGSDCGIANVNTSTNGAEIGGAFGGEKETGGGRESGTDAWKGYMRRQTVTINYSGAFELAQGIELEHLL
ncbi:MAG TPA: aldehyde dehydrogenase family protein [Candidatus Edwardsbacteria bacterium]|nr:aldehyde dehydrogenase family protein [Candidatus Edwardsbacteria bacterium]